MSSADLLAALRKHPLTGLQHYHPLHDLTAALKIRAVLREPRLKRVRPESKQMQKERELLVENGNRKGTF